MTSNLLMMFQKKVSLTLTKVMQRDLYIFQAMVQLMGRE